MLGVTLPLKQPLRCDQDVDIFDATAVGEVEALGEVGLQVWFDLLVWLLALKSLCIFDKSEFIFRLYVGELVQFLIT